MIKLLLQTTYIIQDVNFDKAINLKGSFMRVRTDLFPLEETLKTISNSAIENIICIGNINNDFNIIKRIVLEVKGFKKNLFLIIPKINFKNSELRKRKWLIFNSDELFEISQQDNKIKLNKEMMIEEKFEAMKNYDIMLIN